MYIVVPADPIKRYHPSVRLLSQVTEPSMKFICLSALVKVVYEPHSVLTKKDESLKNIFIYNFFKAFVNVRETKSTYVIAWAIDLCK